MSANPLPYLSPDEYLAIEREAEFKSEYYGSRMHAMSGGTEPHSLLASNLIFELHSEIGKRDCFVYTSDLRVCTPAGLYTYPDISVVCGEPVLKDNRKDILTNPTLIVEILSKSTEAHDRGFKFAQYRSIESLQECVLVSQTEPRVECFRRGAAGVWALHETLGLDAVVHLESVGCGIAMAGIYERVQFTAISVGRMLE